MYNIRRKEHQEDGTVLSERKLDFKLKNKIK